MLRGAQVIGQSIMGEAALLHPDVSRDQLLVVRRAIEAETRGGVAAIGILPVSPDMAELPGNWPLGRVSCHEADLIVVRSAHGLRVLRGDGYDLIRVDTPAGVRQTENHLKSFTDLAASAVRGERALDIVDNAIDRHPA